MSIRKTRFRLTARLLMAVIGCVFIYGAVSKAMEPHDFATAASYLTGWPLASVQPLGAGLVVAEFLVGSAMILGVFAIPATLIAGAMVAIFMVPLFLLANDPLAPACGCFGSAGGADSGSSANVIGLLRNSVLLLLIVTSLTLWSWRGEIPHEKKIATI